MAAAAEAAAGTVGCGVQSQESDFGTDAKRTAVCPRRERALFAAFAFSFLIVHQQITKHSRLHDVHGRAQPVLRVKLQPVVRLLRRGLRCGYHEETVVLHRRYSAGGRSGEHPGVVDPHGAHGTPPIATGAFGRLAAASLSCRAGAIGVRSEDEPGLPLSQTRTTAHVSFQKSI